MPISTSSFGDERDNVYGAYEHKDDYSQETLEFSGLTPEQAETYLKRLGGGVEEKHRRVEGIGWVATIEPTADGVAVVFDAHDELLDDLVRRFHGWVEKG